jgi:hypothetical protein
VIWSLEPVSTGYQTCDYLQFYLFFSLFVCYLCLLESVRYNPTPPVPQNGPSITRINLLGWFTAARIQFEKSVMEILCVIVFNLPGLFRLEFWWTDQRNIAKSSYLIQQYIHNWHNFVKGLMDAQGPTRTVGNMRVSQTVISELK